MIILIGSQKGGPGKTTVAVNLAVEFARQGKDVCLVDADPQRSAARWHADREEQRHTPAIACVEKLGNINQTLQDLAGELDVAPSTATRMCDRLVDKGLIRREVASDNRREVRLAVAPPGKELVSRVTRRRRAAIKRIVERMGPSNRRALVAALEDFAASAGEVPEDQWFLGWK